MAGKQTSSPSPRKSIASPNPPYSSPSVVIDDGVNNSFSQIDGVVVVLVVRRIDGVVMFVLKNDNTDPEGPDDPDGLDLPGGNAAAAAVDCAAVAAAAAVDSAAVESKSGTVSELAPRNASNPGKGGRLVARAVGSPVAPKYGTIGGAAAASAGAAAASSSSSSLLLSSSSLIDPAAFLTAIASANFFAILPPDADAVGAAAATAAA